MENIIIGSLLAFVISFYAMPIIILVSNQKKLYDLPGERKVHKTPIPSLGGLGIFVGFLMGLLLSLDIKTIGNEIQFFLAAFSVVFFFGIKDDILNLVPMKKFMGQLAVSGILMFKAGLVINNMHGFLGIINIHPSISYVLTALTIVVVMNAFNLIDGVDGLAGTISIITSSVFATFFLVNGDMFYALMGYVFSASTLAFLIYNYSPARIFMGDTGSMMAGIVNSILVIHFIGTASDVKVFPILATPAMGFGILLMPLLDTLRVFAIRILQGRSPFSPDRNHLHHLLLDRGFNHMQVTATISITALVMIVVNYYALVLGTTGVILFDVTLFFSGIYFLNMVKLKKARAVAKKSDMDENMISETNIKSLVSFIGNTGRISEKRN